MDWQQLLNTDRLSERGTTENPARPNYVQDADRISFSAPFRRLANKTQVHPLYDNDYLRHRMIHSVEVASVGRTLGMQVGHWLEAEKHILPGEAHKVAGIVHAACLAHDIGNPPFGHSGEDAIGGWFAGKFDEGTDFFAAIEEKDRPEFMAFEGNAQGFRILSRLEMYRNDGGMNLSNAVLGAFTKYPVSADVSGAVKASLGDTVPYVGVKKFGAFHSEFEILRGVAKALGLPEETGPDGSVWWRRHPLVFLVEAADDICYNIVDLEDGFSAGDLSFEQVKELLTPVAIPTNRNQSSYTPYERISYLRARSIGGAISACVEAFKKHHTEILEGRFSDELIAVSQKGDAFRAIRETAKKQLFTAPRKTILEVRGRNLIRSVLEGLLPVYEALSAHGWQECALPAYERQLVRALDLDLRDVRDEYTAMHSMTDFVSGMTDRYALKAAELVRGTL